MSKYNYGYATDPSKLPESEYKFAAHEWAEGSVELEKLLLFCLENGIKTQSCCIGHKEEDKSYIQFEFNSSNLNSFFSIINRYSENENFRMTFYNEPGVISKFEIRFPQELRSYYYTDILNLLRKREKIDVSSLEPWMQDIIEIMSTHTINNRYVEFQYVKEKEKKDLFFASNYGEYCESFVNSSEKVMWIDNGVGIESTPERMMPIISEVKSKSRQIEFGNTNLLTQERVSGKKKEESKASVNPGLLFINSKLSNRNPNINFVDLAGDIYASAQELIDYKNSGKMAFGFFNGIAIDNFSCQSVQEIVDYYMNKISLRSKLDKPQENLTLQEIEKLYRIKEERALGYDVSQESINFEKNCTGKYELDPAGQILVVLDRYYDNQKDNLITQNEKQNQEISFVYNDSLLNRSLRQLEVAPSDSIESVAKKLDMLRSQGVQAFAIFGGLEIDNFNNFSVEDLVDNYITKKVKSERAISSYRNLELDYSVKKRAFDIENNKSRGMYISDEDNMFSSDIVKGLELMPDPFSQTLVALENYSNMINAKVDDCEKTPRSI